MINKIKIKGVSLITLVIVIVVMLILATATILILNSNNIINSGNETVFKQDISHFVENLEVYHNAKYLESNSSYKPKLLNADYGSIYYNNVQQQGNIYDILTNLKDSKYDGIVYIQKGEIVLDGFALTNKERAWAEELRVVVNGKPIIKNVILEVTETEIDIEVNPSEASQIIKYKYRLDDGQWVETQNNSYKFTDLQTATKYKVDVAVVSEENYESDIYTKYVYTRGKESDLLITPEKTEFVASDLKIDISYLGGIPESYVLEYKIGEEDWNSYNTELGITLNENSTVNARIYNKLLDDELVVTSKYIGNIDTEEPTKPTDIEITPGTNTLSVKAIGSTDELSGIKGYKYSIDNGENWTEIKPEGTSYTFTGIKSGTQKTILAKAVDNVLRESETYNKNGATTQVELVEITVAQTPTPTQSTNWCINGETGITNVILTHKEINGYELQYKLSGGMTQNWTKYTDEFQINENNTTIVARMYNLELDDEGNSASSKDITNIDKLDPSAPTNISFETGLNYITATATGGTDALSGVSSYEYSIDNMTWQSSRIFSGIKSGTTVKIYARTVDKVGRVSESISSSGKTDSISGGVTISTNTSEWVSTDLLVTVVRTSALPSGYIVQYKLSGGMTKDWTDATLDYGGRETINVDTNMTLVTTRLYNKVVDDEVGVSSKQITTIDKGNPSTPTTLSLTSNYTSITATASGSTDTDGFGNSGSGISKYQYSINGSTWQDSGTFSGYTNGKNVTVYARAVDKVGRVSGNKSATGKTTALVTPTISVNTTAWTKSKTVTITGSVPSGYQLQYNLNSGSWTAYSSALTISSNNTVVNARIINKSNTNDYSATASKQITNIDTLPPVNFTPFITLGETQIRVYGSSSSSAKITDAAATSTSGCSSTSDELQYAFSWNGGSSWTAYQTSNNYLMNPTTIGQGIEFAKVKVRVKDKVGNVREVTAPTYKQTKSDTSFSDERHKYVYTHNGSKFVRKNGDTLTVNTTYYIYGIWNANLYQANATTSDGTGVNIYRFRSTTNGTTNYYARTKGFVQ